MALIQPSESGISDFRRPKIVPIPRVHHPPKAPASPYKGTGYRSVAFGTWAVGDAGRKFGERRRGKSVGAPLMNRTKEEERMKKEEGGGRSTPSPGTRQHYPPTPHPSSSSSSPTSSRPILSRSLGDIPGQLITSSSSSSSFCSRPNQQNGGIRMRKGPDDLYSSREYVQHNAIVGEVAGRDLMIGEHVPPFCSPPSAHCSLDTLYLAPVPPPSACPPCPPPLLRRAQRPCPPHPHQNQFIVDPLAKRGMMRNRTKSLDNVHQTPKRFPLGAFRGRQDRIQRGPPGATEDSSDSASDAVWSARQAPRGDSAGRGSVAAPGGESRLDAARNFLRRFYAQSTLRLTGRRKRNGRKRIMDAGGGGGGGMYSSAVGPFFEMRKPQPEEVPFLPYNIHYTVESSDGCGSGSEAEEEEGDEAEEESARLSTGGGWSFTPTLSMATASHRSTHHHPFSQGVASHQHQNRTIVAPTLLSPPSSGHHHPSLINSPPPPPGNISELFARTLALPPSGSACCSASSASSSSASCASHHPQDSTAAPTTPSAGYGSLGSTEDSEGGGLRPPGNETEQYNDSNARKQMAPAERRFADWNELFQLLKREIMEMNVRDGQILQRLEYIQRELNGVRQMTQQSPMAKR